MRIQSVQGVSVQNAAHSSNYLYGVQRELLPPHSPYTRQFVELEGPVQQEVLYQFRQIEGWIGDDPVSFTYLTAQRSYENTKQLFVKNDWRTAFTTTNRWLA